MRRREFIRLLGGAAAAWPLAVRAQQAEQACRPSEFMGPSEAARCNGFSVLRRDCGELGWIDGRNCAIE